MTAAEFTEHLEYLGLRQKDAAVMLGVTPRAVRRWQADEQKIPTAVAELLLAWRQLHAAKIPFGADLESLWYGDDDQIRRHQDHDKALAELLDRVKSRGGLAAPWRVNLPEHSAMLGPMVVRFYKLRSGGFSLANYNRGDRDPDLRRDQVLIEDAVAAFAAEVGRARTRHPHQEWDQGDAI